MIDSPAVRSRVMAEPHSDPGGFAVVWGASHKTSSAADCCKACAEHAANPKNKKRPCNSWVFCNTSPQCWSLDTGNWHGFGECWLKWQADPTHPLYGQRGRFTADFRKKHANAHKTGKNPDGTPRNLSVPTHVPWTGGIMGTTVDRSVQWETGLDGMRSYLLTYLLTGLLTYLLKVGDWPRWDAIFEWRLRQQPRALTQD